MSREIKTVLCPVNLRHAAQDTKAYETAVSEARVHGATLHVVTVAPEIERNLNIYDSRKFWGQKLDEFLSTYRPDDLSIESAVLIGAAHRQIVRYAQDNEIGLIVIESSNPRIQDYLLGTTANHVATHAPCSVYVVR